MLNVHATYETAADAPGSIILLQEYNHRMLNEYAAAIAGLSIAASGIKSPEGRAALRKLRHMHGPNWKVAADRLAPARLRLQMRPLQPDHRDRG